MVIKDSSGFWIALLDSGFQVLDSGLFVSGLVFRIPIVSGILDSLS